MKKNNKTLSLVESFKINISGIKLLMNKYPKMLISKIIYIIFSTLTPYIDIYLLALIVDELALGKNKERLYFLTIITLVQLLVFSLINALLKSYVDTVCSDSYLKINKVLSDKMLEMDFNQEKFSAYFSKKKIDGEDVILLKPTTYMNNSGIALRQCMDFFKVSSEDILVLYDDMDMPVGKLRLRQKGSAGGHNGIKSIISHIGTQDFDRIRIGIGKDKMIPVVDWVLGKFPQEQQEELNKALVFN